MSPQSVPCFGKWWLQCRTGHVRRQGLVTGGKWSYMVEWRKILPYLFQSSKWNYEKFSLSPKVSRLFEILKVHIIRHLYTANSKRPIKTELVYNNDEWLWALTMKTIYGSLHRSSVSGGWVPPCLASPRCANHMLWLKLKQKRNTETWKGFLTL